MKKWIIIGSAVVIIIIIFLIVGISNLGPMIKNAVNTYGPRITKTDVRLGDASVSIFSGEAKLRDFYLGNPKGFKSPQAMSVKSIHVDVDEGSLTRDTIIIDKVEVIRPEITYEKAGGTDNFKTILNNVESAIGPGEPAKKQPDKEGGGKKILIRNFIVKDGKVNMAISMLGGKSIGTPLPDIHLKDVGQKKGGASPAEAFEEIFAALYKKITSPAVTDTLNKELKALGTSIEAVSEDAKKELGTLVEGTKKEMETITDKAKGLFKNK